MDYQKIKELAKKSDYRTRDLIVLAPQNDPFYTGTKTQTKLANWFTGIWQKFNYNRDVHLRRIHYRLVSQDPAITLPNGKPYLNTDECWRSLNDASRYARYLNLVDPHSFDDRRNNKPLIYFEPHEEMPSIDVDGDDFLFDGFRLPSFPYLPEYNIYDYKQSQLYHVEVWCEKSTMNEILIPLCQNRGVNLITGLGELSITHVVWLLDRLVQYQRPCRILYVSDFDPAGQSMPVAVSRKLEKFICEDAGNSYDVRLIPLILTKQQCVEYQLPRTPIKEKELRKSAFESRHGEGATELDALEAIHPGKLKEILSDAISAYRDGQLNSKVAYAEDELEQHLSDIRDDIYAGYSDDIDNLKTEYETLITEFEGRFTDLNSQIENLCHDIRNDLLQNMPNIEDYPVPEPEPGYEISDGLYNSDRTYLEQLNCYKAFQSKLKAE
jgi:hypothetical protein